jgi:hypothetical protein
MSSTPTMSIQCCPDEVLDMIFQLLPVQSPDKAPAVLLPTMLTCSRFCAIARRYLIRVVCLQTARRVNLFAAYLLQLTDTGAYGKALLPIEHMAVFGEVPNPDIVRGKKVKLRRQQSASFHLSFRSQRRASAPSLYLGLVPNIGEVDGHQIKNIVKPSVCFPKLQRLILLEQHIIRLIAERDKMISPQHCYPQLMSLYTHRRHVNDDVLALRTLRELRLDMFKCGGS